MDRLWLHVMTLRDDITKSDPVPNHPTVSNAGTHQRKENTWNTKESNSNPIAAHSLEWYPWFLKHLSYIMIFFYLNPPIFLKWRTASYVIPQFAFKKTPNSTRLLWLFKGTQEKWELISYYSMKWNTVASTPVIYFLPSSAAQPASTGMRCQPWQKSCIYSTFIVDHASSGEELAEPTAGPCGISPSGGDPVSLPQEGQ